MYRAIHVGLNREVALKTLIGDPAQQRALLPRLQREAQIASQLFHPGIARVVDAAWDARAGLFYTVMELVRGPELAALLKQGNYLPIDQVLDYAGQLAEALGVAHAQGVVHRDLKPANIKVLEEPGLPFGRLKILDFGIARRRDLAPLTHQGDLLGTPAYMSPEQAAGAAVDQRTDLYAVGIVLHRMLTGAMPFESTDLATAHLDALPQPQFARGDADLAREGRSGSPIELHEIDLPVQ